MGELEGSKTIREGMLVAHEGDALEYAVLFDGIKEETKGYIGSYMA